MKHILLYLLLILIGGILGGTSVIIGQFHEKPTEIWTTTRDIETDNGIMIPKGIEMRVHETMPEGFTSLQLYLNVDGKALEYFDKITDSRSNLIIPHQVKQ